MSSLKVGASVPAFFVFLAAPLPDASGSYVSRLRGAQPGALLASDVADVPATSTKDLGSGYFSGCKEVVRRLICGFGVVVGVVVGVVLWVFGVWCLGLESWGWRESVACRLSAEAGALSRHEVFVRD